MDDQPERAEPCYFRGVSACRDKVSKYICNEHSELFGLTHELVNYTDGNNENWSKIVVYICSAANFHLPLFLDANGEVLVNEIHAFALTICTNNASIKRVEFENRIACLMGMNAYESKCSFGGWLDDSTSNVIVQQADGVATIDRLPQLHRLLLHYSSPAITRNADNTNQTYLVPSLSLEVNLSNPGAYHFMIPNKKVVLKKTKHPNSVATPVVLNGIRTHRSSVELKSFKPISSSHFIC